MYIHEGQEVTQLVYILCPNSFRLPSPYRGRSFERALTNLAVSGPEMRQLTEDRKPLNFKPEKESIIPF